MCFEQLKSEMVLQSSEESVSLPRFNEGEIISLNVGCRE